MKNIKFQSYCWSLGTTSFRVKDLNLKIEKQLQILDELWKENKKTTWIGNKLIQEKYYNKMLEKNFITGYATNKPKDARQKTSGLVQIGVIDDNRQITEIGRKIIRIIETGDINDENIFNINRDSFIYLKQLLKLQINDGNISIKPFVVLLYILSKLEYITKDEFTYILPLCTNIEYTNLMLKNISDLRKGNISIDDIIQDKMYNMLNYSSAIDYIKENGISNIEDFALIDMGRKGTKYIEPIYKFYITLYKSIRNECSQNTIEIILKFLKEQTKKNPKVAKYWKKYLRYSHNIFTKEYLKELKQVPLFNAKNETEYALEFFKILHTAKWKSTLEDYADLNKRYISLSDIIIFNGERIELDLLPKYFFKDIADELLDTQILDNENYNRFLSEDICFNEIYDCLNLDIEDVINRVQKDYPTKNINEKNIKTFLQEEKLNRFNKLIDRKFNYNQLIELFTLIENNDKETIFEYADWESDIPTIFEFILGITWYRLSNKKGNILDYMKLSLNANLLPKSHAIGGTADIVYEYDKTKEYPIHKVLLEATLTESTNQRRSEMEPVSRHLLRELQKNLNKNSYVVFVANNLNEEILSDFRLRRFYQYRDCNNNISKGLKIIALGIDDIKQIILKQINYKNLYLLFDKAYKDITVNDIDWYEILIKNQIDNI